MYQPERSTMGTRQTLGKAFLGLAFVALLAAVFLSGMIYAKPTTTAQTPDQQTSSQPTGDQEATTEDCEPQPVDTTPDAPESLTVDVNVTQQQEDMLYSVRVTNPTTEWDIRIQREHFRLVDENNTVHPVDDRTRQAEEYAFPDSITLRSNQSAEGVLLFTGDYENATRIEYHDTDSYTTVTGASIVPGNP